MAGEANTLQDARKRLSKLFPQSFVMALSDADVRAEDDFHRRETAFLKGQGGMSLGDWERHYDEHHGGVRPFGPGLGAESGSGAGTFLTIVGTGALIALGLYYAMRRK